ncbi:MAG: thioredoxin [Oscillospiraceae bacterium]|nr:thioredoxin [Oscillospiraceae bacterium]
MTIELTAQNFEQEVKNATVPVLVDFWASWCGPCRMLSPLVEQLSEEYAGKAKFGKVNVDEQPQLAMTYRVSAIPTLIAFRNGQPVGSTVGVVPRSEIEKLIG